ncbi:MAG: hypothetical protein AB1716_07835 [Planctomycetota bacterium]
MLNKVWVAMCAVAIGLSLAGSALGQEVGSAVVRGNNTQDQNIPAGPIALAGLANERPLAPLTSCNRANAEVQPPGTVTRDPLPAPPPSGAHPDNCGAVAYENAYNGAPYYMDLLPGQHTADDCRLTGTARDVCQVTSVIYNPNYWAATVYIELWTACPIAGGTLLATSPALSAAPRVNSEVTWDLSSPVTVPETVWVGWRTLHSYVGPLVSGQAEVGYTNNYLYLSSCSGGASCYCSWTQIWAGLDVTIRTAPHIRAGDLNCDGAVNFDDINPFVLILSDPQGWQQQYPSCPLLNGDCNGDGQVNFDDINPFVALLAGP